MHGPAAAVTRGSPDNYRQISPKRSIFAGEMYVEWAADHFGLGLT